MAESGVEGGAGRPMSGGVIALRRAGGARGRHSVLDDVQRYWNVLKGGRLVPLRSDIDPRGIEGALDSAFIVERIAPGIARFRLAGSFLVDLMGSEVRGMPLSVMFAPGSRGSLSQAVEGVFSGPETLRMGLTAERGLGRPSLRVEMLLLPLRSDLGDVSRALGCLSAEGSVGRTPRRLEVRSMERTDLVEGGPVAEPRGEGCPAPAARLRPVPGAPHLKVVEPS